MTDDNRTFTEPQQAAAAAWLSRRDRGLSAAEQDAYFEWLAVDPDHARAIQHMERVWQFCDRLEEWRPEHSSRPNPDLLAPTPRRLRFFAGVAVLSALAGALALSLILPVRNTGLESLPLAAEISSQSDQEPTTVLTGENSSREVLEDGSTIEMSNDAIIDIDFSASERRLYLIRGEVSFTVTHDESRPFVVEVSGATVQALGTVFSVVLDHFDVSVEVTEGSVEVREAPRPMENNSRSGIVLGAGEKAVLRYARLIPFDQYPGYKARSDLKE